MAKLILCGKPNVLGLFRRNEKNLGMDAQVSYCEVDLRDLIPLTWKLPVVFENGNDYTVTDVAARLLFVENREALQREYERQHYEERKAAPGDFIVVLPLSGAGEDVRYDDRGDIGRWLSKNKVKVGYVGGAVPADVDHVLRNAQWKRTRIYSSGALHSAIEERSSLKVSIFDAVKLKFCIDGVEAFQRKHFPNREAVLVRDLVPHLDNPYVLKLVCHMLKIDRLDTDRNKALASIATALGVNRSIWL